MLLSLQLVCMIINRNLDNNICLLLTEKKKDLRFQGRKLDLAKNKQTKKTTHGIIGKTFSICKMHIVVITLVDEAKLACEISCLGSDKTK